jgi:hypothetical protein
MDGEEEALCEGSEFDSSEVAEYDGARWHEGLCCAMWVFDDCWGLRSREERQVCYGRRECAFVDLCVL